MSRSIFGWSLPPGCSMSDIENACGGGDDSSCAHCLKELPEEFSDDSWPYLGFCNATCAVRYSWLMIKQHPSPNLGKSVYEDFDRALREVLEEKSKESKNEDL